MVAVLLAVALILGTTASQADLPARLDAATKSYHAAMVNLGGVTGNDVAYDYYARLVEDRQLYDSNDVPDGYTAAQFNQMRDTIATLDLELVNQLMTRTFSSLADVRGLHEVFIKSSVDGTMQPAALYVPASYDPAKPAPLVVFLHGRPQSESELMAPGFVTALAQSTGSIVIAPYGRGYYDYRDAAASDVYDAFDAIRKAFSIDARRQYLAGYSMGGFSVFEVAPMHATDWSAVMCISGGLLGHDALAAVRSLQQRRLYVLTGDHDPSIPTQYTTETAAYLAAAGVPTSYYRQPGGLHRMVTLLPILTQAWSDMHAEIIRDAPPAAFGEKLLPTAPAASVKI